MQSQPNLQIAGKAVLLHLLPLMTYCFYSSTVFVSNLPYTATSTDLKTQFSDVAPVKNAFVVLEKDTKISKGVGYVVFAMREDAVQCVEKGTMDMNGRTLRVDWAGAKVLS